MTSGGISEKIAAPGATTTMPRLSTMNTSQKAARSRSRLSPRPIHASAPTDTASATRSTASAMASGCARQ